MKLKLKKKQTFLFDVNYKAMEKDMNIGGARRVGNFIEAKMDKTKTFIIDFNLSRYRGMTLLDMAKDLEGINMLNWILERDNMPDEVKDTIRDHLKNLYGDDIRLDGQDSYWG